MYSSTFSPTSSPYTSPPPAATIDPYRSSPIPVAPKQPYNTAFSPPPLQMPNAYSAMPVPPQRYQQPYPAGTGSQYARGPVPGGGPGRYASPHSPLPPQRHKGTLAPGQVVKVGDIAVKITRYLSEGGYAHVYLTSSEKPIHPPSKSGEKKGRWGEKGYTEHCLKRIAFEDDSVWVDVKKEIEVMKSLPPSPHLVQYLGHAHSRLPTGGHEVFILMEFCSGGGIIDLLNKRLRDRLKEIEILNIFTDVCEAVAAMHHLRQPLLHRDLKIENVLSQPMSSTPTPQRPNPLVFKLCDFGSTTFPADKPPASKIEADALAMDLNKHTTLQYRSPEMVEPMLGLPVGLPSDVWALGCLLYKLCYYTTPFEEHGPLAIVNAKYTFPPVPVYSPKLQHLIASMLVEQPHRRPSVFEILKVAHEMSGTKPEIDYPVPSRSFGSSSQQRQAPKPSSQPSNLLDFTSPTSPVDQSALLQPTIASSIQPQRRGRPTRESSQKQVPQTESPVRGMPPMPVPPVQVQSPSGSSAQAKPQPTRLQLTGDKPPSSQGPAGVDAFGMPAKPSTPAQQTERGFSDSFGASMSSGSTLTKSGSNLPRPPSGVGDAFGRKTTSSLSNQASPQVTRGALPVEKSKENPSNFVPGLAMRQSPEATEARPSDNHHHDFDIRFPSIETLSSADAFSPPLAEPSRPENLISPITSPPSSRPTFGTKTSMMGNMTGGDLRSQMQTLTLGSSNQPPQPRSTHVTGTAFRAERAETTHTPSSATQNTDYFGSEPRNGPANMAAKSPMPEDLMNDEESQNLLVPSMEPGRPMSPLSITAESSRSLLSPATGPSARPLPSPSTQTAPSFGFDRSTTPNERTVNIELDSSDEEMEPESASGTGRRPSLPRLSTGTSPRKLTDRAAAFDGVRDPTKSTSTPIPGSTSGKPAATRGMSTEKSRPQSMIVTSSSRSTGLMSPLASEEPTSTLKAQKNEDPRPPHERKGSITNMVSRYESMKPPAGPSGPNSDSHKSTMIHPPATNGAAAVGANTGMVRKPSVASKPQALRKSTVDSAPGGTGGADAGKSIPSPTSPVRTKPQIAAKPTLVVPKPIRHDESPRPDGFSRSSSGRSFPITKAKPDSLVRGAASDTKTETGSIPSASAVEDQGVTGARQGSPEKQQPVNLLIQRWNQGQVNSSAKPPPKRGGYN